MNLADVVVGVLLAVLVLGLGPVLLELVNALLVLVTTRRGRRRP